MLIALKTYNFILQKNYISGLQQCAIIQLLILNKISKNYLQHKLEFLSLHTWQLIF